MPQEWTTDPTERPVSWAFQLALALLGPLFFLSYLLTILSPLPLLYLFVGSPRHGRAWTALAIMIGLGLSAAIKGWFGALGFFLFAAVPAVVLGEMMSRKFGLEKAVLAALGAILFSVALVVGAAKAGKVNLWQESRAALSAQVATVSQSLLAKDASEMPEETREELEKLAKDPTLLFPDLPGIAASVLLLLCVLPTLAIIRWNPKGFLRRSGLGRDYLRKWRSPDWLVWVALACGAFHLFEVETVSAFARNALKPLLLIYFFQGMSILAYFLDSLRLRGPLRVLLYGAGTLFLTPMVVSFGFFDLWFNFRGRHRPKVEEKEP